VRLLLGRPGIVDELDIDNSLLRQEPLHAIVDGGANHGLLSTRLRFEPYGECRATGLDQLEPVDPLG
jgi:hypothetical protein